ncbi:hypothetical protein JW905_02130, partial [bacterium]|nr:hypothetical protein [candidate division CSSED10-310 bacterium]
EDRFATFIRKPRIRCTERDYWIDIVVAGDRHLDLRATELSCLVALTTEALESYVHEVIDGGVVISIAPLQSDRELRRYVLPLEKAATDENQIELIAIAALGALITATEVVSARALESALMVRVAGIEEEYYTSALQWGLNSFREAFGWQR